MNENAFLQSRVHSQTYLCALIFVPKSRHGFKP